MSHQDDLVTEFEAIQQRAQIVGVLGEAVRAGPGTRELVRVAGADEVHRDEPPPALDVGQYVAPQVGGHGVTVQEDDRPAVPFVQVGHGPLVCSRKSLGEARRRRDRLRLCRRFGQRRVRHEHREWRHGRATQVDLVEIAVPPGLLDSSLELSLASRSGTRYTQKKS
jgi:hypothetical protein